MNHELNDALQAHLQALTEKGKIHGAGYCVVGCGEILAEGMVGAEDSIVDTQSITKIFTAAAILQLQEKRLLSLQDKVADYLQEFRKEPFSEITILQLLTHTSGLVALQDAFPERDSDWESMVDRNDVKGTWISAILDKGLFYRPGTKWEYSKAGFCILGEILRRLSGQKSEDYISRQLLLPCEMKESYFNEDMDPIWKEIPRTAWGLMAPIKELLQFGRMLADGGVYRGKRVLLEESIELLETNFMPEDMKDDCWDHGGKPIAYGAGCPVYLSGYEPQWRFGEKTIYHEGAGASMLLINRKKRLAAVWTTPFTDKSGWCEEAVKGTATVLWRFVNKEE